MIPQEILAQVVEPLLPSRLDALRLGMSSKYLQEHVENQDKGKGLPKIFRVITIRAHENRGGFENLNVPIEKGIMSLNQLPFPLYENTLLTVPVAVRYFEPYFDFEVDFKETFFQMTNIGGTPTPLKKFQALRCSDWRKLTDYRLMCSLKDNRSIFKVSSLFLKEHELRKNQQQPTFLIGWCERGEKKSPLLFGVRKDDGFEVSVSIEKKTFNRPHPIPIVELETKEYKWEDRGVFWEHVPDERIKIKMFAVFHEK